MHYYKKLNKVTRKYHFPLPFLDQMLDKLFRQAYYYFLGGYTGHNQTLITLEDSKEKKNFYLPIWNICIQKNVF